MIVVEYNDGGGWELHARYHSRRGAERAVGEMTGYPDDVEFRIREYHEIPGGLFGE